MIGTTLHLYLASAFLRNVAFVFALFFALIFAVDLIELSRDLGDTEGVTLLDAAIISLTRTPIFAGNVLPFAVLFGAATSLLLLNRRLELVVARAAGVSVWQFLLPMLLSAILLGAFFATVYNPFALEGQRYSRSLEAASFGKVGGSFRNKTSRFWQRLPSAQGDSVIHARNVENTGETLRGVTVFRFDDKGVSTVRYDAKFAQFERRAGGENAYVLRDVVRSEPGETGTKLAKVDVPTNLTSEELQARVRRPEDVSFWDLPMVAEQTRASAKNPLPFVTERQSLLSQPLMFVAMVLIAATMSLGFARFGVDWGGVAVGIAAGFVLYVMTNLVLTFGSNGLVPPWLAAWAPGVVATLIGTTVILHREDG